MTTLQIQQPWSCKILTLSPEIFPGPLGVSIPGRALSAGLWKLEVRNIREFAKDNRGTVDDTPYGGGGGMVLKPDIIGEAIDTFFGKVDQLTAPIIYMSPRGAKLTQEMATSMTTKNSGVNIICGRFEGIDERIFEEYNITEISIGDYILSCGDIAAMVMLDVCIRLIPGALGNTSSLEEESFSYDTGYMHLLEYPHYTKPKIWRNRGVPDILSSGHHSMIRQWRLSQAEHITQTRRPDLWSKHKT